VHGAILADLSTWALLNIFRFMENGAAFALEFLLNAGVIALCLIIQKGPVIPDDSYNLGFAFLTFMLVSMVKIAYYRHTKKV
jgi:hypothetical protein